MTWPTVTPSMGNFLFGSPLALAFAQRAIGRYTLGHPGWQADVRRGLAVAQGADSLSYVTVVSYVYTAGIPAGALLPHDSAVREIEDALSIAERSGDDLQLGVAWLTLGLALVHRDTDAERDRGQQLLAEVRDVFLRGGHFLCDVPMLDVYIARETARRGGPTAAAIVKPRMKPRNAYAGSTTVSFRCSMGIKKRPRHLLPGRHSVSGRRPLGARRQVEVARMGPCWRRAWRVMTDSHGQGGG